MNKGSIYLLGSMIMVSLGYFFLGMEGSTDLFVGSMILSILSLGESWGDKSE